ncbi:hypothetical protein Terro_3097 [Terriglobus roseus DSM 18391]|uniref:Uncharacterized protein n=2 Tax=Terriglobus roseus TaxID=392734 RepID=I3ZJB0_TERRK|nr:hypothetical protein Terro_3097 [Terriglobus roseus DSM 18391]
MGRPYQTDLDGLVATAEWADNVDVTSLSESIGQTAHHPLIAVGSGGSKSVACLSALLHRRYTGNSALDITPLLVADWDLQGQAVQMFTASGANPDILGCFARIVSKEPEALTVISSASISPLATRAEEYWYTDYFGFEGPIKGEGFVATNSILAQSIVMMRAYERAFGVLSESVSERLKSPGVARQLSGLEGAVRKIGRRRHAIVLFGEYGQPAATDLESKFSEVGIASVQLADYRNFAHGRHNWIDKHLEETVVISIEVGGDSRLASRTLRLLPDEVPVVRLAVEEVGPLGALIAMYAVIRLIAVYGQLRGIDPGRPGVPPYGSRLYRLNAWSSRNPGHSIPEVAITRKAGASISALRRNGSFEAWMSHLSAFLDAIESMEYSGLALDYDGTICDQRDRFVGIAAPIREALVSVIERGTPITVITGRGRSVGDALRRALPKLFWDHVRVAYYNGSELRPLAFDGVLDDSFMRVSILDELRARIEAHPSLKSLSVEMRRSQLSISTSPYLSPDAIQRTVSDILSIDPVVGVRVFTSAHSVDVLLPVSSKRTPIVQSDCGAQFLCIGDSGEWPGNDFEMLSQPGSLSCHRMSRLTDRCWHISPTGWRNSQATLHYLASLRHSSSGFRIDRERLLSSHS